MGEASKCRQTRKLMKSRTMKISIVTWLQRIYRQITDSSEKLANSMIAEPSTENIIVLESRKLNNENSKN